MMKFDRKSVWVWMIPFCSLVWACSHQGHHRQEGSDAMVSKDIGKTEIRGRATLVSPMAVLPGPVKVQLIQEGVVLAETEARLGEFRFEGRFPKGSYLLRAWTKDYSGEAGIDLHDEPVKEIRVALEKKKSATL